MMKEKKSVENIENSQAFSLATLLYTRLRRVKGRVIDVVYFMESKDYARGILTLAQETNDADLLNYAERLTALLDLNKVEIPVLQDVVAEAIIEPVYVEDHITEDDIYRAQVSHHYIGALR